VILLLDFDILSFIGFGDFGLFPLALRRFFNRSGKLITRHFVVHNSWDESVFRDQTVGWMTKELRFDAWKQRVFSFLHRVRTSSGAQPATYTIEKVGAFSLGKSAGTWKWPFITI